MFRARRAVPIVLVTLVVAIVLAACGTSAPNPPAGTGKTIAVTPSQNLATVVKDAPAGSTLSLANGSYTLTSPLAVTKGLTLKGSGAGKVTITLSSVSTPSLGGHGLTPQATSYQTVVDVSGGTFTASGVTLAYAGSTMGDVVNVYGSGKVSLTDCIVEGGVKGTGTYYYIGNGIRMQQTATATINGTTFRNNGNAGIAVDGDNQVTIDGSTFTANATGVIFYATAHGTLKGSTITGNSGDGVWMGSATGGPTPTLDGNTITANGGNGIHYDGGSAGTASNNTITGNAQSGVRVSGAAHPSLDGNDIHDNVSDGITYEGTDGGSATNNKIHSNGTTSAGSKGIRVINSAHPTLTDNQVTGNRVEGISFGGTSTGSASGNVIDGNTANGLTVWGQATPTLSNNTIQNNTGCGLLLQDSAQPTLSGNTESGNGTNVCDQRSSPPPAPIATTCPTDNSLNPDPSRYLAVVVEDAKGAPVANTDVSLALLSSTGDTQDFLSATTDSSGVALLADTTVNTWDPQGTYSGAIYVDVGSGVGPRIQLACGNIQYPGTIVAAATDSTLSPVSASISAGSATVSHADVGLGFMWNNRATLLGGFQVGASGQILAADGSYTVAVDAETSAGSYAVYAPLTVSGATPFSLDVSQQSTTHVTLDALDGSGSPATAIYSAFLSKDPSVLQNYGFLMLGPDYYLTPGAYHVISDLDIQASSSDYWDYNFDLGAPSFPTAGGNQTVSVGGPLTTRVTTSSTTYSAGNTVVLTPSVTDGQGHALRMVSDQQGIATQGLTTQATTGRLGAAASASPQALGPNTPTLTVRDPSGAVVYQTNATTTYLTTESFKLPGSAATGTYTVSFSWNIGVYQSAPLTASTTFQVQ